MECFSTFKPGPPLMPVFFTGIRNLGSVCGNYAESLRRMAGKGQPEVRNGKLT